MASFTQFPGDSGALSGPPPSSSASPVTEGPRWYRRQIRLFGPLVALLPPTLVGVVAYFSLQWFDTTWSGVVGLVGGVMAAPGLLAAGAPFGDRDTYPIAVLASGLLWLLVGYLAARRATRNPMATWGDFFRHYSWLLAGVWLGSLAALGVAAVTISDSLI